MCNGQTMFLFFRIPMQAKDTLQQVMTAVARTLHVARVDEGKKKDYLLEMKMRKLGPATVPTVLPIFGRFRPIFSSDAPHCAENCG